MFREYIELIELSKSMSALDRTIHGRIGTAGRKTQDRIGFKKTVVKMNGKVYLIHKPDYDSLRLVEVDVVEE